MMRLAFPAALALIGAATAPVFSDPMDDATAWPAAMAGVMISS